MNSLGLFLIILQFLSGSVSNTESHLLGIFNIFDKNYSVQNLALSLNAIIGPVRNLQTEDIELGARGAIIIDNASSKVLYNKNANQQLPIASLTKLMTAIVSLDNLVVRTGTIITVHAEATLESGSRMYLVAGEKLTAHSLLKGLLIESANDAAATLSLTTDADKQQFVDKMNQKAKDLGLRDTHFANPTGFDAPNHYSSASDLAKLTQFALQNQVIADIIKTPQTTVVDVSQANRHTLVNTNQLVGKFPNVIGVKTGTTGEAGTSLIVAGRGSANQIVIVVLLDSPDRFGEGKKALDWALNGHSWIEPI